MNIIYILVNFLLFISSGNKRTKTCVYSFTCSLKAVVMKSFEPRSKTPCVIINRSAVEYCQTKQGANYCFLSLSLSRACW